MDSEGALETLINHLEDGYTGSVAARLLADPEKRRKPGGQKRYKENHRRFGLIRPCSDGGSIPFYKFSEQKRKDMERGSWLVRVLLIVCTAVLVWRSVAGAASPAEAGIPRMMTWTSYDVGSAGYFMADHIRAALQQKYEITIRLIPAATDLSRVCPLRLREAEAAFSGLGSYFMQEGLHEYSALDWGPQPVRVLYLAQHPGLCLAVRGDSYIHTADHLRGGRVAASTGLVLTLVSEIHLAFAGLNWEDVQKMEVPGYTAAVRMVMDGELDAAHVNPASSVAYKFAAAPYGMRYIPLPAGDKEGWARIRKLAPFCTPVTITAGAGLSPEKPLESVTYAYPVVISYASLPEEKAHAITKLLRESYPLYAQRHKSLEIYWKPELFLKLFLSYPLPLHRGTVRYLKERGEWTPELEELNNRRLAHQKELKELWVSAVEEALAKKIKAKAFPEFWLKKRKEAGL